MERFGRLTLECKGMADERDLPQIPEEPPEVPLGQVMGDVPLFREIQRVLLAGTGPVNWELARQVGIAMASWGVEDPPPSPQDLARLTEAVRVAELAVADFTGMPSPSDITRVETYRRAQWVEANIRDLREILDPIGATLGTMLASAQGGGALGMPPDPASMPGMEAVQGGELIQALLGRMVPLLMGAQVGTVLGYLGQRVLGQYDLAVPRPRGPLYFVVPNITRFERDWSLAEVEFREWVAIHEVVHRFEFAGAGARPHFISLVTDLVQNAELDLSGLERRLEDLDLSNPDALSQAFEGVGNLFGEATTTEQRLRVARVQSFLAAAEGYGEHVVETLATRMLSSHARIDEALLRFREGRPGDQAVERLLGLEMKPEIHALARGFCTKVVELTGESTLARMWESPDAMPSMPELEEPQLWLARSA